MRTAIRFFIVVIFLGLLFGGIFGWKYLQGQRAAEEQARPPAAASIAATRARAEEWQPAIRAVGSLVAINGVEVTTEIAGKLSEIAFESGEEVTEGDVLVRLDDSVDRAALEGLIADRELARVQFERSEDLLPRRAVSQSQFDEARARYDGAQAGVAEAEALLAKKTIRTPFDGLLGLREVSTGEYLSPGMPIVTLRALDPIYVDYSLPGREFRTISVGQRIEAVVDAYPDDVFEGRITAIDSGVDEGTRSIHVRATLDNPGGALRPGMFTQVRTLRDERHEVVTIPRTAISYNTYGDFVFVIEEGDGDQLTANRRQVRTGGVREGWVEVVEGLGAGERVVRAGLVKLRDGQSVTIDESVELDDAEVSTE